jgi:hypothetical protein
MASFAADLTISADGNTKLSLKSRRAEGRSPGSDVTTSMAPCSLVTGNVRVDLHVRYAKTNLPNPRFTRIGEQAGCMKNAWI